MIHVRLISTPDDPKRRALILSDSGIKRLAIPAIFHGIPLGHYKLSYVDRFPSRSQKETGDGRVRIADLNRRDIQALTLDEKVEATLDDDHYRIDGRKGKVGGLGGNEDASIHGGGESLSYTQAFANYQPLTQPPRGVRVYNADLAKLMNYLEPRLRCLQLVIFSVL